LSEERVERRLTAIPAAGVAVYWRLNNSSVAVEAQ
jgi:hypothetical protein